VEGKSLWEVGHLFIPIRWCREVLK
jgi:hypothetical protein